MIIRQIEKAIESRLLDRKAIILIGPRQVGKTTMIRAMASRIDMNFLYVNGDDPEERFRWKSPSWNAIKTYLGKHKVVVFDEAQRITEIGLTVKMIIDSGLDIQVFITGSSALDIANQTTESLTGRKWEFNLFGLSYAELSAHHGEYEEIKNLHSRLLYGSYPEVINYPTRARETISQMTGSYLYKDILDLNRIKKPEVLYQLLKALAWQVGHEVNFFELSRNLSVDKNTVSNYIDLLEKAYVIFRLQPLSRNPRKEITTSRKIYFFDNGVRNAIIQDFTPIVARNDVGALWENYVISERYKFLCYTKQHVSSWFWRSKQHAEIDYIEEIEGNIHAYEMKWNPSAKATFSSTFQNAYSPATCQIIHPENYWNMMK